MELGGKVAMSETSTQDFFTREGADGRGPERERPARRKRRRLAQIAIAAGARLVLMIGVVVGGGYLYVNHLASSVHRIQVAALTAAHQPAGTKSMNVLLTTSRATAKQDVPTGLIEPLHPN